VTFADLPSVDQVLQRSAHLLHRFPRSLVTREIRAALEQHRAAIRAGHPLARSVDELAAQSLEHLATPSLRYVINATGVILHTNLGRAPLPGFVPIAGYSNLEYDLASGRRGKRDSHYAPLLEQLLGVPAIAVNNNAAATYLVLNELAQGGEVIVSRGELIEIGDGFRIPDIMERSGAILREVGTTNKTSLDDYRRAINDRTRLILRVHPSNFHITGFTAKPSLRELASLGVPVYEDLGSGCLVDLKPYGVAEPLVGDSLAAGVQILSFSCDKLLGGPQTGIIAGQPDLVARVRRNPMYRAFRPDKLIVQALSATLLHLLMERYNAIPTLRMIRLTADDIRRRATALAGQIPGATLRDGLSVIGGGSTPDQSLPTCLLAIPGDAVRLEKRLRANHPPVIARIEKDELLIDLRTVDPVDELLLLDALRLGAL
jgi:L-seryl-tRNA(Ser) seleniumtransferase